MYEELTTQKHLYRSIGFLLGCFQTPIYQTIVEQEHITSFGEAYSNYVFILMILFLFSAFQYLIWIEKIM